MKKRILSVLLATAMLLATTVVLFTSCGKKDAAPEEGTYTRMTVDINPSVEFMVDDQNKVVSVTALNDDGSILIAGEAFVGKTPEEAVEMMVSLATETGYLIKGNVEAGENEVKISVSGNSEYAEQLMEKAENKAKDVMQKLDIEGKVAKVEAMKTEKLQELALETGLFTEEEVAAMTEKQLYAAIAAGRAETALLLTEEMRNAYYSAKESRISFANSEATAEVIEAMGGIYEIVYFGYKTAVDTYSAAITALDEFRYESLVSPDSEYQKSLAALRDAKTDLLKQKNYVASLDVNGETYATATVNLQLSEENYEKVLAAYEALGEKLNASLEALIASLRENEANLRALEDKFSDNIKAELQAKAGEIENAVNEAKDGFFAEFENEHKGDIEAAEQALIEQKNKLKEAAATEKQ